MPQGSFGRVRAWNDFLAVPPHTAADTVPLANGSLLGGGWGLIGVNEGAVVAVVDEPGGVLSITTDTADHDNAFISSGVWKPADGGMRMEARIKVVDSYATLRACVWVGFTETLAVGTPVPPYEIAAATAAYNGSGGMVGFAFDSEGSTDAAVPKAVNTDGLHWRFIAGDGGAALATKSANGTTGDTTEGINAEVYGTGAPYAMTENLWTVFRVEVDPDGLARGYVGDAQSGEKGAMRLVGESTAALATTDCFHAAIGIENRSAANEIL